LQETSLDIFIFASIVFRVSRVRFLALVLSTLFIYFSLNHFYFLVMFQVDVFVMHSQGNYFVVVEGFLRLEGLFELTISCDHTPSNNSPRNSNGGVIAGSVIGICAFVSVASLFVRMAIRRSKTKQPVVLLARVGLPIATAVAIPNSVTNFSSVAIAAPAAVPLGQEAPQSIPVL
jgi:hypothetical protein